MASGQSARWLPSNSRCPSYRNYSNSRRASLLAIAQSTGHRRPSIHSIFIRPSRCRFSFSSFSWSRTDNCECKILFTEPLHSSLTCSVAAVCWGNTHIDNCPSVDSIPAGRPIGRPSVGVAFRLTHCLSALHCSGRHGMSSWQSPLHVHVSSSIGQTFLTQWLAIHLSAKD